ncbi:MAG: hypothetical protein NW226_17040 [Microscillaceae bacterium]|nr:hypothetical protein [Microscillaceae bacterium]
MKKQIKFLAAGVFFLAFVLNLQVSLDSRTQVNEIVTLPTLTLNTQAVRAQQNNLYRTWCQSTQSYAACSLGNGPSCSTAKSCPAPSGGDQ